MRFINGESLEEECRGKPPAPPKREKFAVLTSEDGSSKLAEEEELIALTPSLAGNPLAQCETIDSKEESFLYGTPKWTKSANVDSYRKWFSSKEIYRDAKKISTLSLEYALTPIALTKTLLTPPMGKRGDRGYLLDDRALDLLPTRYKHALEAYMDKYDSKVIFVNGGIVIVPKGLYRLLRANKQKGETGLKQDSRYAF